MVLSATWLCELAVVDLVDLAHAAARDEADDAIAVGDDIAGDEHAQRGAVGTRRVRERRPRSVVVVAPRRHRSASDYAVVRVRRCRRRGRCGPAEQWSERPPRMLSLRPTWI